MMKSKLKSAYNLGRQWMNHSLVRQYGSSAAWIMTARIYWTLSSVLVGIFVARKLGPELFGSLNYAIAFAGLFFVLITGGIDSIITRDIVSCRDREKRILGNTFVLRLFLYCVLMAAVLIISAFTDQSRELKLLCLIISIGYAGHIFQSLEPYFIATIQSKYLAFSYIGAYTIYMTMRIIAIICDFSLYFYAWTEVVLHMASNLLILYFYWEKEGSPFRWSYRVKEIIRLFKPLFALSLCSVIFVIYSRTDILMLEYFLGSEPVGYYTIATKITETFQVFGVVITNTLFPAIVSASKISLQAYHKQIHRLYFILFWLMVIVSITTIICGRWIVFFLYGEAYLAAIPVLYIYICILPGAFLLNIFGYWATNEDRLAMLASILGSGAVLNLIFNVILIPAYGMNGAAFSSLISMPLAALVILMFLKTGRAHLKLIIHSIFTLPSIKLGEDD